MQKKKSNADFIVSKQITNECMLVKEKYLIPKTTDPLMGTEQETEQFRQS